MLILLLVIRDQYSLINEDINDLIIIGVVVEK